MHEVIGKCHSCTAGGQTCCHGCQLCQAYCSLRSANCVRSRWCREMAVSHTGTPSDHHSYLTSCYAVFATLKGSAHTFPALWRSSWCVCTLSWPLQSLLRKIVPSDTTTETNVCPLLPLHMADCPWPTNNNSTSVYPPASANQAFKQPAVNNSPRCQMGHVRQAGEVRICCRWLGTGPGTMFYDKYLFDCNIEKDSAHSCYVTYLMSAACTDHGCPQPQPLLEEHPGQAACTLFCPS